MDDHNHKHATPWPELDYIPLSQPASYNCTTAERRTPASSSLGSFALQRYPSRDPHFPLPHKRSHIHDHPDLNHLGIRSETKNKKQKSAPATPHKKSPPSCFVVPAGESITLYPPPHLRAPRARVSVARLAEVGWIKTDLCSRITRYPDRFAGINIVLFYDLDNAAGWFHIEQPLPPSVLLCVFSGGDGCYGSLPLRPLAAGLVPENRLFVTVCGGGKNSADFAITYAAGELNRIIPKECMFAVVSNDADFRHLMSHLRKTRPNSYQIKAHATVMAQKNIHCVLKVLQHHTNKDQAARRAQEERAREVVLIIDDDTDTDTNAGRALHEEGEEVIILDTSPPASPSTTVPQRYPSTPLGGGVPPIRVATYGQARGQVVVVDLTNE